MRVTGIDGVVLSAEDVAVASRFFQDLGLAMVTEGFDDASLATRDDTRVDLRRASHEAATPEPSILEMVWGAYDSRTVEDIANELAKDRDVRRDGDGTIHTTDNDGYGVAFRVTRRSSPPPAPNRMNIYGAPPGRPVNNRINFREEVRPAAIAHIVLVSTDVENAIRFYVDRLGFRITDRFVNGLGTFLRSADSAYHHNLFIMHGDAPGLHHIAFAVADFNDVMLRGQALLQKGWQSTHGPGRHVIGSNYFWYFKSPCGAMELTADVDRADDDWVAGEWEPLPQNTMAWSLEYQPLPGHGPVIPETVAHYQASFDTASTLQNNAVSPAE